MALKKTFYPSKQFEDELEALALLFQAKGWEFPGDAIAQLVADAEAQRTERAAHETARTQFIALHETFGLAQLARFRRFVALLKAARGMFRDDKAVIAELDRFGRSNSGRPRKTPAESEAA